MVLRANVNAKFCWKRQWFCEQHKVSWWNKGLQGNTTFLWETKVLWADSRFLWKNTKVASKHKASQGNAKVLQANTKFLVETNFKANVKFLKFYWEKQRFCNWTTLGKLKSFVSKSEVSHVSFISFHLLGKSKGFMSESKVSLVNAKVFRVNAPFLRKRKDNISLGNAEVLREQADLADCILAHVAFLLLVSHQFLIRMCCVFICLCLTVIVVEVGLQAVEVVLSVFFVSLIESSTHLLHTEAAVQEAGKR